MGADLHCKLFAYVGVCVITWLHCNSLATMVSSVTGFRRTCAVLCSPKSVLVVLCVFMT